MKHFFLFFTMYFLFTMVLLLPVFLPGCTAIAPAPPERLIADGYNAIGAYVDRTQLYLKSGLINPAQAAVRDHNAAQALDLLDASRFAFLKCKAAAGSSCTASNLDAVNSLLDEAEVAVLKAEVKSGSH